MAWASLLGGGLAKPRQLQPAIGLLYKAGNVLSHEMRPLRDVHHGSRNVLCKITIDNDETVILGKFLFD
jgi:hypothetical protein